MKICKVGHVRVLRGRSLRAVQIGSVIAKHEQGRGQTVEVHSTTITTPRDQASVTRAVMYQQPPTSAYEP